MNGSSGCNKNSFLTALYSESLWYYILLNCTLGLFDKQILISPSQVATESTGSVLLLYVCIW